MGLGRGDSVSKRTAICVLPCLVAAMMFAGCAPPAEDNPQPAEETPAIPVIDAIGQSLSKNKCKSQFIDEAYSRRYRFGKERLSGASGQ